MVFELDAVKLAVTRRARGGNTAVGMQLSPANDALWVLYRDPAALVEIPLASMQPERRIKLPAPPDSFDLGAGNRAGIGHTATRGVTIASLTNAAVERTIAVRDEPSLVCFRKDGRHLFVASRPERALGIFEVATGKTVVRLPLPVEPRNFTVKPDGGQLFISGPGMDAVVVVYVYETEIAETLLAGRAPGAMAAMDAPALPAGHQSRDQQHHDSRPREQRQAGRLGAGRTESAIDRHHAGAAGPGSICAGVERSFRRPRGDPD